MYAIDVFRRILTENKRGRKTGVYSVCSSNDAVLKASMMQAKADHSILLIESTSNQVNQEGGYTGMTPRDFVDYVFELARQINFSSDKILLGGDHLGPNTWQHLPSGPAMEKARILVQDYVKAGYQKIHLDTSRFTADDEGQRARPLADEIVARRTAELCLTAERAWQTYRRDGPKPLYVIGTEVPAPGGSKAGETVKVTSPEDAARTISVAKKAFHDLNLKAAWDRVCAIVVQPGVEFSDDRVHDYRRKAASNLSREIEKHPNFIYEAHSTDYQTPEALAQMVSDHFCILKVGPWLTFAYREALFILADIERILYEDRPERLSCLPGKIEAVMVENSRHWRNYYTESDARNKLKRKFSYLDRIRYYWPDESLRKVKEILFSNLRKIDIPPALLSQYMPNQYIRLRQGRITSDPEELVFSRIQDVLIHYSTACNMQNSSVYKKN